MKSKREAQRDQRLMFISGLVVIVFVIAGSILFDSIRTQAASTNTTYKYYTSIQVEQGDTLWNIANKYMTEGYADLDDYIEEICVINRISAGDIHSGQYLTIPYYSGEYLE